MSGDDTLRCRCGAAWTREELAKIMGTSVAELDAVTSIQRCSRCSGMTVQARQHRAPARAPSPGGSDRRPVRQDDLAHDGFVTVATFFAMNFASNARDNPGSSLVDALLRPNPKLIRKIMAGDKSVAGAVKKQVHREQADLDPEHPKRKR